MLKRIINKLSRPLLLNMKMRKYGSIWRYKKVLLTKQHVNAREIEIYDSFFKPFGSWIGYNSEISATPCFPHGLYGIFISGAAKIGKNCVIFQQVTIGSNTLIGNEGFGAPVIGDNVYIGAGAKIIGNVVIGNNCRIGANAVVYKNMPDNSVAVQAPTRLIEKTALDNRFFSKRNNQWHYYQDEQWLPANSSDVALLSGEE
jgi:serine O-acetyltransferase